MTKRKKSQPRITQQETLKRSSFKLTMPDYNQSVDSLALVLCIPNDVSFVIALQSALAYWEAPNLWIQTEGVDKWLFKSHWGRMIATMECLDLSGIETQLTRLADAAESIDTKTPELVDLKDIFDHPENWFAAGILPTIAPLMEIGAALSDLFPTIKVDPFGVVKWVTGMLRHTQIVGALGAIAAAIMAGVAGQGTQTLISLITGAFDYLMEQQKGLQNMRDWLFGVANSWFSDPVDEIDQNYSQVDYSFWWHNQNTILGDIADSLRHANEISQNCAGVSCLCVTEGGGVLQPDAPPIDCFEPPPPFTWQGYLDYSENVIYALHTMTNAYISLFAVQGVYAENLALRWWDSLKSYGSEADQSPLLRQLGNDIILAIEDTLPTYWMGNQTQNDKANLITSWTIYFKEMLDTILSTDDEQDVKDKAEAYFFPVFQEAISEYSSVASTIWQQFFASGQDSQYMIGIYQTDMGTMVDGSSLDTMVSATAYTELKSLLQNSQTSWTVEALITPVAELGLVPAQPGFIDNSDPCGV